MRNIDLVGSGDSNSSPTIETKIIVKCFTQIGSVPGMGKVEIDAREHIDLDSHQIHQFVTFQITSSSEYAQTAVAPISYDAIDSVIDALDRLSGVNPKSTKYKQIEVQFSLGPDFKITAFNDAKGKLMFSVGTSTVTAYFVDMNRLHNLKSLVLKAKKTIEENRPPGSP